jgi:predicted flavoprotein YhiN
VDSPRKTIFTILSQYFPKRFAEVVIMQTWIDTQTQIGVLTRDERQMLVSLLGEGVPLTLIGRRPWDEFVTAGGVARDEIDPQTMQSHIVPWLYFAGEVVDVDGVTWWYNLQRCRASGAMVGKSL